ncbi:MAG: DUF2127 domain-containing protein [Deltaproteobacteria bacterium]
MAADALAHALLERAERRGVRAVAVFEACKGALVLVVGFGLSGWLHRHADRVASQILLGFHLNPAHHYPRVFLESVHRLSEIRVAALVVGAALYAVLRFVEAYGLWHLRSWSRWFAVVAAGVYIPVEVYESVHRVSAARVVVLLFNIGLVAFLIAARAAFHPAARAPT